MSIRHFILGLLTQQPMSGYDIKGFLKSLGWLIDSPSFGSLYPALHALLEDGLVTVEVVTNKGRPSRKMYSITEAGQEVLEKWMNKPAPDDASLKSFVMRLALAGHLSRSSLRTYLEKRRVQVAEHQLCLEQTAEALDEDVDLGERLTIDYGLVLASAELNWLEHTLSRLSRPSLSVGATLSNSATSTV